MRKLFYAEKFPVTITAPVIPCTYTSKVLRFISHVTFTACSVKVLLAFTISNKLSYEVIQSLARTYRKFRFQ